MRALVSGRVQGVFFRADTQRRARSLGLAGWVRNTAGGEVEVFLQGEDGAVEAMVEWLHRGPPQALVSRVQVTAAPPDPSLADFRIRA